MIVICKKGTKRLVKGLRYEVQNLWNDGSNQKWIEGKIEIKNVGRFVAKNFTDTDGNPLPKVNVVNPIQRRSNHLDFKDIKEGDILVCTSNAYKTMIKDGMYKVEYKEEKSYKVGTWTGTNKNIKFVGVKRKLKFSPWNFRALTSEESREISLKKVLDGEEPEIITTTDLRKIDMVDNKDLELIKILCKSVMDTNRHHLSIVDWACEKTGSLMSINKEDYKPLMDLTLSQILEKIEK